MNIPSRIQNRNVTEQYKVFLGGGGGGGLVTKLCSTLETPKTSLQGSFVHGILYARILEWVTNPFSTGGASDKEPICQCRRHKRCRFNTWVKKIPWRRAWQPSPVFLPGESHGEKSLEGYSS